MEHRSRSDFYWAKMSRSKYEVRYLNCTRWEDLQGAVNSYRKSGWTLADVGKYVSQRLDEAEEALLVAQEGLPLEDTEPEPKGERP